MRPAALTIIAASMLLAAERVPAANQVVGAAPKGDATAVAVRIIKRQFPRCQRVSAAARNPNDGSIRAKCDGTDYVVLTVFNASIAKTREVALECSAAKSLFNVSC